MAKHKRNKAGLRTLAPDIDPDHRCDVCGVMIYVRWLVLCLKCEMWNMAHGGDYTGEIGGSDGSKDIRTSQ